MDTLVFIFIAVIVGFAAGLFVRNRRPASPPIPPENVFSRPTPAPGDLIVHLSKETDTESLMKRASEWLQREFGLPLIVIYTYDFARHDLTAPVVVGRDIPNLPPRIKLGFTTYGSVASNRIPHFIENIDHERRLGPTSEGMRVAYLMPLVHDGMIFGVLCAQSDRFDALREPERMMLDRAAKSIATLAAMTTRLDNSRLVITRFDQFQRIAQRLTDRPDKGDLLQEIADAAREMLETQMSVLLNIDTDRNELLPIAWAGISRETASLLRSNYKGDLKGLVAWAKRPARTANLRTDQRTALATQAVAAGMLSELAVPVIYSDKLYGVLAVETDVHRHFTDEEMNLLSALAAHAGIALRNAQLFDTLQRTNRQLENTIADLVISRQQAENARLTAVEANSLKTQFVNNMSHELRTPLNAVINFTRIVMDGHVGTVNDQQIEYLGFVHDSGQHLLGLINDILDLAKIEAGKMDLRREPTDLEPILRGVMSTAVGLTRDKGLTLHHKIPPNLPQLNIDGTRIRQVLLNLFSNAAKFTDKGSITLTAEHKDDQVIISVRDTGIGIAPQDIPKVFEEFRQIDGSLQRAETGTGLGMPISQRFIQLHGGNMWIESTPNVGTTVFFSLPVTVNVPV